MEYPNVAPTSEPNQALALWMREQLTPAALAKDPMNVLLGDLATRLAIWICDQADAALADVDMSAAGYVDVADWLSLLAEAIHEMAPDPGD